MPRLMRSAGMLLALLVLAASLSAPAALHAATQHVQIGTSLQGRPIQGLRLGTGPRSVVVAGAIHGNEVSSARLVEALSVFFSTNLHLLPPDVSLYLLPALNPDGLASGSRYNARGVDLNRNWLSDDWQPDSYDASGLVAGAGGAQPFSEPEAGALAAWLLGLRESGSPPTVLFYHAAYPPSGLVLAGSLGADTTRPFAAIVGARGSGSRAGSESWSAYPVTGSAVAWCREQNLGCFDVELPSRTDLDPALARQHALAVLSVLLWQQNALDQRCFIETGFCIAGAIRSFWERHGGLATFGLPLGREQRAEGQPWRTQWFERTRLELHPESPAPFDVQLGRVGVERLEQQGNDWWTFPRETTPRVGCRFFAETGQNVCGAILEAWQSNGLELDGQPGLSPSESLALLGLPLSPAREEPLADGRVYRVQWFERARIELHPEQAPPFDVQFGLLGRELAPPAR